jgi:Ser/Thr protein kinase RdoA (MazF antagonist)
MLRIGGRIYELFEFIPGTKYDSSLPATSESGRTLALFHKLLAEYRTDEKAFAASYHGAGSVAEQLNQIAAGAGRAEVASACAALRDLYAKAAARVEAAGLSRWPRHIVHGDWHPGNTLYRGPKVVAVIDFDGVRSEARALDVANGALQFSITMNGADLEKWPDYLDESRYKRFCRGYDSVEGQILSVAEVQAMPWLMIEALIVEAVAPITTTGMFAGFDGGDFLRMIRRKAGWLEAEAAKLVELVAS